MHTDPIADMLTRIRNAQTARKPQVLIPYSKLKFNIAQILEQEKWVAKAEKIESQLNKNYKAKNTKDKQAKFDQIKIELIYENGQSKIKHLSRVSKPGRRVYTKQNQLPTILNNYGIALISTTKGVMTNKQAKQENLGGEVICQIY